MITIPKNNPRKREKSNIALIGFMYAGKTSVGKEVAGVLGKKFVDTDDIIEQIAHKSVSKIFEEEGEGRFREIEIEAVKKVSKIANSVISCGGGVVNNKVNIDRLKKSSYVVFLRVSAQAVFVRAQKDKKDRPLLHGADKKIRIKNLIEVREPLYTAYSDFVVDTTDSSVKEVANKIIAKFGAYNDSKSK